MKKTIQIILLCVLSFCMMGCIKKNKIVPLRAFEVKNTKSIERLNQVVYPNANQSIENTNTDNQEALLNFTYQILSDIFTTDKNQVFSPVSLYIALSMLTEGISDLELRSRMEKLLGLSTDQLRIFSKTTFANNYYSNDKGRTYLANSIWVQHNFNINSDYIDLLQSYYFVESYRVDFSSVEAKKEIIRWINHYTENLLELDLNNYQIKDDLALLLLNTIYFNQKWKTDFEKKATRDYPFYVNGTSTVSHPFMYHEIETKYDITETYTAVVDEFENGNRILYVMPNQDSFSKETLNFQNILRTMKEGSVKLAVPKFEYKTEYALDDWLVSKGLGNMYFEGYFYNIYKDIKLNYVKQNVGIKFSEEGVEAAAVTSIGMDTESIISGSIYLRLDKPFYYVILDSLNTPLFIGYTLNPSQTK